MVGAEENKNGCIGVYIYIMYLSHRFQTLSARCTIDLRSPRDPPNDVRFQRTPRAKLENRKTRSPPGTFRASSTVRRPIPTVRRPIPKQSATARKRFLLNTLLSWGSGHCWKITNKHGASQNNCEKSTTTVSRIPNPGLFAVKRDLLPTVIRCGLTEDDESGRPPYPVYTLL